jgi:hypothetical protein
MGEVFKKDPDASITKSGNPTPLTICIELPFLPKYSHDKRTRGLAVSIYFMKKGMLKVFSRVVLLKRASSI